MAFWAWIAPLKRPNKFRLKIRGLRPERLPRGAVVSTPQPHPPASGARAWVPAPACCLQARLLQCRRPPRPAAPALLRSRSSLTLGVGRRIPWPGREEKQRLLRIRSLVPMFPVKRCWASGSGTWPGEAGAWAQHGRLACPWVGPAFAHC